MWIIAGLFKLILKILALPVAICLSLLFSMLYWLFCYAVGLLNLISGFFALFGMVMFFIEDDKLLPGLCLFMGYIISPFGLPRIAEFLFAVVEDFKDSLWDFIMGAGF